MAVLVPSRQDYATFFTVDVSTVGAKIDQALIQAAFLMGLATGWTETPTDEPCATLFHNGILDMARWIALTQDYVPALASPYQSETIGSYSYSKGFKTLLTLGFRAGDWNTGVFWFDLAAQQCSIGGGRVDQGGVTVFEQDNLWTQDDNGRRWVLGPKDMPYVPPGTPDSGFSTQSSTWTWHP
jgi:hypothetical protein